MQDLNNENFVRMFTRIQIPLREYILAATGSLSDVDDIAQDVSVVLWRKFSEYDDHQNFLNWSIGIARLEILKRRRDHARHPLCVDSELVSDIANRYEQIHLQLEQQRIPLRSCIEKLPQEQRRMVQLRYEDDLSARDIAQKTHRNEAAVYKVLSRIRSSLAECVKHALSAEAPDVAG